HRPEVDDICSAEEDDSVSHSADAGDCEHDLSGHADQLHGMECGDCGRVGLLDGAIRCRRLRHSGARARVFGVALDCTSAGKCELPGVEALYQLRWAA